jgi:hypothetical protein
MKSILDYPATPREVLLALAVLLLLAVLEIDANRRTPPDTTTPESRARDAALYREFERRKQNEILAIRIAPIFQRIDDERMRRRELQDEENVTEKGDKSK